MAKERVLVVDDEEDILELVRFHLTREGYQLTLAATGEDTRSQRTNLVRALRRLRERIAFACRAALAETAPGAVRRPTGQRATRRAAANRAGGR